MEIATELSKGSVLSNPFVATPVGGHSKGSQICSFMWVWDFLNNGIISCSQKLGRRWKPFFKQNRFKACGRIAGALRRFREILTLLLSEQSPAADPKKQSLAPRLRYCN